MEMVGKDYLVPRNHLTRQLRAYKKGRRSGIGPNKATVCSHPDGDGCISLSLSPVAPHQLSSQWHARKFYPWIHTLRVCK